MTVAAPVLDAPPLVRHGLPEYVQGASPAAGALFSSKVTGWYHERLVSVSFRLVTDGNAANRSALIEYLDGEGNRFMLCGPATVQTASTTTDYYFSAFQAVAEWPVESSVLVPLAPILLPPTFSWKINVGSIQATDAITRVRYVVERFYTPDSG